jgi:heptosyltransferase-2
VDRERVQSVFVRAPNWVGDFVMATGAFERLRLGFPQAKIVLGARPYLARLTTGTDWFDEFVPTPRAGGVRGLLAQVRELRTRRFDLAVVLPNSLETGLVPFLAGVRWRLGYRQGRPFLMNFGLRAERGRGLLSRHGPRRVPEPMPAYYARLLDRLGLPPGRSESVLAVTPDEAARADAFLRRHGLDRVEDLVLVTAGASYGASKLWVPERFAALARHFAARPGTAVVFLAGPAEVEMVEQMAAAAGCVAATDPVLPLDELKALTARARLMITTDTGPRHVALALGVPVVCLIGPTDRRYTDYALERSIVIRRDLPCSPCQRKECPLGHHACMREISVDEVVAAAEQLLAASHAGARSSLGPRSEPQRTERDDL